ncbi:MAG: PaaI family thioesterase [bacterium]
MMTNNEHFRKLERMYLSAPINELYSPKLTITKGQAELMIPIHKKFFHAATAVHGSVYFKALDDAAFFAANSLVEDVFIYTVSFHVHFIRPITDGEMRAVGRVVHSSRNLIVADSIAYDSRDREIGRGSGNFMKSRIQLTAEIGYA